MRAPVVTLPPNATAREAAVLMRERRIGSVVVAAGGRPAGIVTEADLARRVVADGRDPAATTVAQIMSTPLATIEPSASVEDAARRMKELKIKRLIVVMDGEVRGMVSATDIAYAEPEIHRGLMDGWRGGWQD